MTDQHENFDLLLPWHVNGTLDIEEDETVRRHASSCVTCRGQLRELVELSDAVRKGPIPSSDAAAGLRAVKERLAENPTTGPAARHSGPRLSPGALRWVLLAQAAALVSVAVLFGVRGLERPSAETGPSPAFRTLATPRQEALTSGTRVRVLFSEDITEQEIRELLHSAGGRIVDGPSQLGLFVVELDAGRSDEPSLAGRVAALRAHDGVRFAELATTSPSTP